MKNTLEISDLVKVESSNIDMVGFNEDTTYVKFKNGSIYSYPKTGREEFEHLKEASSVGSYFSKTFKLKSNFSKLENVELKKKKATDEEMQDELIKRLRWFSENNMHDSSTGVQ